VDLLRAVVEVVTAQAVPVTKADLAMADRADPVQMADQADPVEQVEEVAMEEMVPPLQ
jgi:hypothetical protein